MLSCRCIARLKNCASIKNTHLVGSISFQTSSTVSSGFDHPKKLEFLGKPDRAIASRSMSAVNSDPEGSTFFKPRPLHTEAQPPSYDVILEGNYVTLAPVDISHAEDLFELLRGPENTSLFQYLFDEPYDSADSLRAAIEKKRATTNPWTYTILSPNTSLEKAKAIGMASLMRMDRPHRVIEVGSILYTRALQRTPAATEAMYLLANMNAPSRRAAVRLGFEYEGTFRQHMILKGQNRDTAWYSMLDKDWPVIKKSFEDWLNPENFDAEGNQKKKLEQLRN